jgi:hypothetical protein
MALAQASPPPQNTGTPAAPQQSGLKQRDDTQPEPGTYQVNTGTHILLSMINTVDTRHSRRGDRIYLATAFPVVSDGRIIIPQGSWVNGTVTEVKRGKGLKGRDEMRMSFDSLTLPNGVTRVFRGDLASADGRSGETLQGDGKPVVQDTALGAASGTAIGAGVGAVRGELGKGIGVGAGAGAAAGFAWALFSHAPNARLGPGTPVDMVLDRNITFSADDLNFANAPARAPLPTAGSSQQQQHPRLIRRIPIP